MSCKWSLGQALLVLPLTGCVTLNKSTSLGFIFLLLKWAQKQDKKSSIWHIVAWYYDAHLPFPPHHFPYFKQCFKLTSSPSTFFKVTFIMNYGIWCSIDMWMQFYLCKYIESHLRIRYWTVFLWFPTQCNCFIDMSDLMTLKKERKKERQT